MLVSVESGFSQWLTIRPSVQGDRRYDFTKIVCSDSLNCTVVGFYYVDGEIYANHSFIERTVDGGASWVEQEVPLSPFFETVSGPRLRAAVAVDSLNVFVAGDFGIALRTIDAGQTWNSVSHGDSSFYALSMSALDTKNVLIGGYSGKLKFTTDWGNTWQHLQVSSSSSLGTVKMLTAAEWNVFSTNKAILFKTTNGGQSWDSITIVKDRSGSGNGEKFLRDVAQHDRNLIVAVGGEKVADNFPRSLIMRSRNGGLDWDTVLNDHTVNRRDLLDIEYVDPATMYAGGGGKWLVYSTDSGSTWRFDTINDVHNWSDIRSIVAPTKDRILLAGAYGFYSHLLTRKGMPGTAAVERFGAGESLIVYPNPARNEITIQFESVGSPRSIQIVDCLGRVCMHQELAIAQRRAQFDISRLPQGMYFVSVGSMTRRIIKVQ